jgi:hypothetical protein
MDAKLLTLEYQGSKLMQECSAVPCSKVYPLELRLDIPALAELYMNVTSDTLAQSVLDTWSPDIAPCSGNITLLGCDMCGEADACGAVNPATGRPFCLFRYVECTESHRVTAIRIPGSKVGF